MLLLAPFNDIDGFLSLDVRTLSFARETCFEVTCGRGFTLLGLELFLVLKFLNLVNTPCMIDDLATHDVLHHVFILLKLC